jgi:hypothetical protein
MVMKPYFLLLLCLILALGMQISVSAQDIEEEAELGDVLEIDIEEGRNEIAITFEAAAGDVVYILTGVEELTFDDEVEIEIENEDGDEVGFSGVIILDPFAIAEIETDGTYTANIDYRASQDNVLEVIIGESGVVGAEPLAMTLGETPFVNLAVIRVEEDGEYEFTMTREDGDLAPALSILDFSESYPTHVADISGGMVISSSAVVELEEGTDYILLIGETTFMTYNFFPSGEEAEVTVSLTPAE